MKLGDIYKNRLYIIFILLVVFSLYTSIHITDSSYSFRSKKAEEMKYSTTGFSYINSNSADTEVELKEHIDTQVFDELTLLKYILYIKNMDMLFIKLVIILSFFQFFLYIKRWIILVFQIKIKFFVMRYQELTDGKKNALSYQIVF